MSEELARRFHETYERLAPEHGFDLTPAMREFDPTSPNGRLMIAVTDAIEAEGSLGFGFVMVQAVKKLLNLIDYTEGKCHPTERIGEVISINQLQAVKDVLHRYTVRKE